MGAIAGTGVALLTYDMTGWWIPPAMVLAGILGGTGRAAIPAFLCASSRKRNPDQPDADLCRGAVPLFPGARPWRTRAASISADVDVHRDTRPCPSCSRARSSISAFRPHLLAASLAADGEDDGCYAIKVVGLAPAAARHGGFSAARTTWATMLVSGALAGLAGLFEAAGPFGQLTPQFPVGYGFTAIIVAFSAG
jgi:simple sugar transport system permease protein